MKCVTIALSAAAFLGADNAKGQQQAALPHRSSDGYDSNVNDGMWSRSRDKSTCTCTPRQFRTRSAPAEFPASCSITSMRCTAGKNWMRRGARPSQTRGTSWSAIASGYPAPTPSTSGATIVRRVRAARRASYKQSNTMFGTIHASAISQDRSSTSTPLLPKYSRTIPSFPSCWRATTAKRVRLGRLRLSAQPVRERDGRDSRRDQGARLSHEEADSRANDRAHIPADAIDASHGCSVSFSLGLSLGDAHSFAQ
mmetsp:Transcript_46387/g.86204  ORF Transcript_46387/g.86204 Transcript_46387/m.86204 type:complete len:254 (+) Transcript_46387:281-1042(+)